MCATSLLLELESLGFTLRVADGKLLVSPASKLTADQRAEIVAHKRELVFLTYEPTADDLACLDDSRLVDASRWQAIPQVIALYHLMLPKLGIIESVAKKRKRKPETGGLFAEAS